MSDQAFDALIAVVADFDSRIDEAGVVLQHLVLFNRSHIEGLRDWSWHSFLGVPWDQHLLLLGLIGDLAIDIFVEALLPFILASQEQQSTRILLIEVIQLDNLIDGQFVVIVRLFLRGRFRALRSERSP